MKLFSRFQGSPCGVGAMTRIVQMVCVWKREWDQEAQGTGGLPGVR